MTTATYVSASRPRTPTPMEDVVTELEHTWDSHHHVRLTAQNLNSPLTRLNTSDSSDQYFQVLSPSPTPKMSIDSNAEEKLRRKVAFFFMDPVRKFIARRQTPWKLFIQFLKIILVTFQLMIFGNFGYEHTNYFADNEIGFEHLFLKDWDSSREINAYPPSTGAFALYMRSEFYDYFDNAADVYYHLEQHAVNPIFKNSTLDFCIESFIIDPSSSVPEYDKETGKFKTKHECITVPDKKLKKFESNSYLKDQGFDVPWDFLEKMQINFTVRTTTYRKMGPTLGPACFTFDIKITFDNSDHDGQITIRLESQPKRFTCPELFQVEPTISSVAVRLLDFVVIVNCGLSFMLCCRAIFRAQTLCVETRMYFKSKHNSDLSFRERFQFLNLWYIMICINDVLIIVGSALKETIDLRESSGELWNYCSVFLGSGSVLVWTGMLRYLGFFDTYNVLILTLKGALPNVIRFVICAGMVYLGYTICGWVVLGPYHFKFRTLESTLECLFSLVNGDDMFATFNMISDKSMMVHGFSRIYLYSFIMLFIYVILSLFIAIIMDTYEVIKEYYKNGFPKSRVDEFYSSVEYDIYSDVFISGHRPSLLYKAWAFVMIKIQGEDWRGWNREMKKREMSSDTIPILS